MTRSKPKTSDPVDGLVDGLEVDTTYTPSYWDVDPTAGEHINECIALLYRRIQAADQLGRTDLAAAYADMRSQLVRLRREWRDLDMHPKMPRTW